MRRQPPDYRDRMGRSNPRYFFISYSHKDEDIVYETLEDLFSSGINYLYDRELTAGDVWNEEVKAMITSDDCAGCIFFISENFLKVNANADATLQEVKIANQRREQDPSFKNIPVRVSADMNEKGSVALDAFIFNVVSQNLNRHLLENANHFYNLSKNDTTIYCSINDTSKLKDAAEKARVIDFNPVYIRGTPLEKIITHYQSTDGEHHLKCGLYPQHNSGKEDSIIWDLIGEENTKLFFLSHNALTFCDKDKVEIALNELNIKIQNQLSDMNYRLDLLDQNILKLFSAHISRTIPTDFADVERKQVLRVFWINDLSNEGYMLINSANNVIGKDFDFPSINAGIRPLLIIEKSSLGGNK